MRIIAGSARGARLEVAGDSPARPFLELARGALFNSLGAIVPGASALDLYAGSGALGLEALSRGARGCVFVERDPAAFRALERNIAVCRFAGEAKALRAEVGAALGRGIGPFDLVFADPPFPDLPEWGPAGARRETMFRAAGALRPGGVLVFRMEEGKAAPPEWPGLELVSDRRYGRSTVCRYARPESE